MPFWRSVRILVLCLVLLFVAVNTYLSKVRTTDWDHPLWVVIYPINADASRVSEEYINNLSLDDFADIEHFFEREAKRYRLKLDEPVQLSSHQDHKRICKLQTTLSKMLGFSGGSGGIDVKESESKIRTGSSSFKR
jgi:hypothetical protein